MSGGAKVTRGESLIQKIVERKKAQRQRIGESAELKSIMQIMEQQLFGGSHQDPCT